MLSPTQEKFALEVMNDLLEENGQVTSLDLKNVLRTVMSGSHWVQEDISAFLAAQGLPSVSNGTYLTYYPKGTMPSIFGQIFPWYTNSDTQSPPVTGTPIVNPTTQEDLIATVGFNSEFTKKGLKKALRDSGKDLSNFNELFTQCNFTVTGKYTSEGHKIYIQLPKGTHYSRNDEKVVNIKNMAKPHILNSIRKYYGKVKIKDIADDDSELSKLLKAYFTWDSRNNL